MQEALKQMGVSTCIKHLNLLLWTCTKRLSWVACCVCEACSTWIFCEHYVAYSNRGEIYKYVGLERGCGCGVLGNLQQLICVIEILPEIFLIEWGIVASVN